jgi:hypothetical protein
MASQRRWRRRILRHLPGRRCYYSPSGTRSSSSSSLMGQVIWQPSPMSTIKRTARTRFPHVPFFLLPRLRPKALYGSGSGTGSGNWPLRCNILCMLEWFPTIWKKKGM